MPTTGGDNLTRDAASVHSRFRRARSALTAALETLRPMNAVLLYLSPRVKPFVPKPLWALAKRLRLKYRLNFGLQAETTKARPRRLREGFFDRFCQGRGLDIGYGGDLVVPHAVGWDKEDGDAQLLRGVEDASFDFVYASHLLEHLPDLDTSLTNWWRVLRPGGHLIIAVPHRDLYEKRTTLPSRWNADHKHFFLPDRDEAPHTVGLEPLLRRALPGAEVVYVKVCDEGHTVTDPDRHPDGEYSIEAVLRKPAAAA